MTAADAPFVGVRSETAPLRRVVTATPTTVGDFAGAGWRTPDEGLLLQQHLAFRELLTRLGVEVVNAPAREGLVDYTFVHDSCFVVGSGFVELNMRKPTRSPEPPVLAGFLRDEVGVPQIATISGDARVDGGDMFWLDDVTLAIGRGYRTNAAAVEQMRAALAPEGAQVVDFDLPAWRGPDHVLRPGVIVMTDATPRTQARAEAAGIEVHTYAASEINKGDGGPTCLTRPVQRG